MGLFKKIKNKVNGAIEHIQDEVTDEINKPVEEVVDEVAKIKKIIDERVAKEIEEKKGHIASHVYDLGVKEIEDNYDSYINEMGAADDWKFKVVSAFLKEYKAQIMNTMKTSIRSKVLAKYGK